MNTQQQAKPWYKQWFDENYLLLYRHRNRDDAEQQSQLIIHTLHPAPNTAILDLACGEGRYTALLKEKGYNVVGVDISKTLIQSGCTKYPGLDLRVGDMRCIDGHYDLILSLFTSFGYFDTDEENQKVIHSIYNALNPNGVYWLDFFNAPMVEAELEPYSVSQIGPGIEAVAYRKIEDGRIIKDIHFRKNGWEKQYRESVRLFTRQQLEQMFRQCGFHILHVFGDYSGASWTRRSPRTIVVGRKES